jgi:hypothetical protein
MKSKNLLDRLKSLDFTAEYYEANTWKISGPGNGGILNFWLTLDFDCDNFDLVEKLDAYYVPVGHMTSFRSWNFDFDSNWDDQLETVLNYRVF